MPVTSRRRGEIQAVIDQSALNANPEEYLSIAKAASIARVSDATMRRAIGSGAITALVAGSNRRLKVKRGDALALRDTLRKQAAPSVVERAKEKGALTAKAFPMFEDGASFIKMCVELGIDSDTLEALYGNWQRLKGLDAARQQQGEMRAPPIPFVPFVRKVTEPLPVVESSKEEERKE